MTNRVLIRTAIAGVVAIVAVACQGDFVSPDEVTSSDAVMAKGEGGNGGGGGGGGDGKGDLYSELLVLHRDANGVPIVIGPFEGEHGIEYCVQPITTQQVPNPCYGDESYVDPVTGGGCPFEAEYLPTLENPVSGNDVTLVPLFAHFPGYLPDEEDDVHTTGTISPTHTVEEGGEPCDPLVITLDDGTTVNYALYATEADLERLNLGRTQPGVLEGHLEETILLMNSADWVTLDAAGRFAFEGETYEAEPVLDAGPKLQAVRQELLETGVLPNLIDDYGQPFRLIHPDFSGWDTWQLSAFALGGAASKFGSINVDIVAYHDRVLNIVNDWQTSTFWPLKAHQSAKLNEGFVDYSSVEYVRASTFPGCVVYLDPAVWDEGYKAARLLDVVEFTDLGTKQDNIAGYAQMAEDSRSVIYFIHLYDSVLAYADPIGMESWEYCVALAEDLNDTGGGEDNLPPTASFTYMCDGPNCTFTDASTDSDGYIVSWSWTFGDGGTSVEASPSHTYAGEGSFTVWLTVTDNGGATASTSQLVTVEGVSPPPGDAPVASFTYECNNTATCSFTDTSTGTGLSWSWTFAGGDPSILVSDVPNPIVTFQSETASNPTITLTVTDEWGQTDDEPAMIACSWVGNQIRCK